MNKRRYCFLLGVLAPFLLLAQTAFVPNAGQWNANVLFKADIRSGSAFISDRSVTYAFYNASEIEAIHERADSSGDPAARSRAEHSPVHCYAYEMKFLDADRAVVSGRDRTNTTVSYFIGNDAAHWAGGLPTYNSVHCAALYSGIDVVYYNKIAALKYDFLLKAGADPALIRMQYNGQKSLTIHNGALQIDAGFLTVREIIPAAYQVVNGKQHIVRCEYLLDGNTVSFRFPDGYDAALPLVIDPEVLASTYSGGTAMALGFTATYDDAGNIYAGGLVYSQGYPVTLGAYDLTFAAMHDIGISKFDPAGSNLLYCTYIGGMDEEYPQSMIVHGDNLYVLGSAGSTDFPVTANAFDGTHNGVDDMVVFALNSTGSALQASTFVGGSGSDGQNFIGINLGDIWRGEIFIDDAGSVYVASGTLSGDFPVTAGAYCTTINGGEDAVIFKMNSSLSNMTWATFLGGSIHDFAMGIRVDEAGYVYACGTFRGIFGDFPSVPGSYQSTYLGGANDGFIAKFDPSGSSLVACTYVGGTGQDVAYFIDRDKEGDIYVCGQAKLGTTITSGVYANPGSSNFIAKFNAGLTELLFSTLIGDGTVNSFVTPSAFMVDNCKRIFMAGFGGSANWPLTDDALYSTWDTHHQWYLACFSENAGSLLFGSLYGSWHVDGGTSRFDKKGIVYQAACTDSAEFPVVPWAYADGSNTTMWDIGVFKIDFAVERDTLLLPNVFTPNGDGINDVYDVDINNAHFYELHIFDRWGTEVFSASDLNTNWDGTYGGRECEEGVYYVSVKYGYCQEEPYVNSGFVHLQRSRK